ncbi:MAG: metallophosphoesterase [Chitinophagaceae bacterium]|nr:metallophosphoesterase [Chitinophagaceae bacterium]
MSRFIPLLIAATVLFLLDLYAFQAIRHSIPGLSPAVRRVITVSYWLITAATIGSLFLFAFYSPFELPQTIRVIWFGALIIFYLPKILLLPFLIIDDSGRLIRWVGSLLSPPATPSTGKAITRSDFLMQAGLLVSGLFLSGLVYGVFRGGYNYTIRRAKVKLPHLPDAFNGLRIVQISDIHSGSFTVTHPLKNAVELINEQQPDLVFFTGDLVNSQTNEMLPYIDIFKKINAKMGVYSIFGNHDYGDYNSWPDEAAKQANLQQLVEVHRELGWKLLRNENVMLGEEGSQLAIIGMENWGTRFQKYGDMTKSYAGAEKAAVKLLLSHDPSHWDAEVTSKFKEVDVTFSGHTHGAQMGIEIPGFLKWSPSQYLYKQWAGLYREGKQFLYVNRGLGFLAYPGRLGISPEITVMELVKG